jgi:predicted amidohydrolase YtcJ
MRHTWPKLMLAAALASALMTNACKRSEPASPVALETKTATRGAGEGEHSANKALEVALVCAGSGVMVTGTDEGLQAKISGTAYRFEQVEAASGAKYRAVGDDLIVLWNKGDEWSLSLEDGTFETCTDAADAIYVNGDIVTMDDDQPAAEALAIRDGKIVAVGARAEIERAYEGDSTDVVDLQGKTLLPGFIDSHSHYYNSLLVANQAKLYPPPSGPGKDVASIIRELEKFAAARAIPKGEMIVGYGYDDSVMPNGRLLNRDDLDAAFPDNPVRVDHVSMHGTVLNSLALEKFGISAETKTPPGGVIVRKPGTNEPFGLIMEMAFLPVMEQQDPMTPEQEIEATRAGQMLYAQAGVTTAQEGATHLGQLQAITRAAEAGVHIIDVVAFPFIADLDKILEEFPVETWGEYENGLKIGGVKISIDGSPQGRTAYFTTPYLTGGPGGEKNWTGELFVPQDFINESLRNVYSLGVPVTFHANGDGAIDALLEAHEFAAADDPTKYRNVTAIHAQFTRKDQIPRFVKYKIRPSFYTLHTFYFAEAHIANRGRKQAMYISPMRDAIDAGLHPTNHTDFVVAPLDQMMMLWSAVNRISRGGRNVGSAQRVTPLEGLKTMTIWAAEQYSEQDSKGSLEPGKRADLVILNENPLRVDRRAIKDIRVLETIKDGETIYRQGS